ncbi:MAG: ATP-dependent RNA helicase HrpA, partial [Perlucidibaca sp.]
HTQPRRIAARAVASRIAEELGTSVGEGVGFKVRFSDQTAAQTYLKLMTDGVLLAELAQDRLLRAYDTIIIDEAHERSLNIDFLLGYLKTLLPRRPDLKLLITSATIDVQRFSQHFSLAPVFVVEGRSYPVEMRYRPPLTDAELAASSEDEDFDRIEEAIPRAVVEAVEECLAHERAQGRAGRGDILVFSSSEREIRVLADTLRKYGPPHTEILPLYARLSVSEQQKVFQRGSGRRIVIATNVAETSLTVPNIHYVIDPGFARISRYSYRSKVQRLPIEPVSQASANQRAGRCGRIAPGVCMRLYSEQDFLARAEFTDPEIRRTNLAAVILQMQVLGLGDLDRFPFLDRPDQRLVNDGFRLLEELGAVDGQRRITGLGRQLARLPLDPRLARMVVAASSLGALREVLIIVAALSVQDPRERPHDKQQAADERHAQFRDPDSDFLFFVNLWNVLAEQKEGMTERERREFARRHFLSWMRLREWRETWRQLTQLTEQLKLPVNREPAPYEAVHRALLSGLLSQIAQKGEEREYLAPRNQKAQVFPGSVLARKGPPWIMAAELVETHRVFLRLAARIEPEWVEKLAGDLLKRSYSEPHWARSQGRVIAYEQTSLFGLILHSRRRVNYEPVNRVEAREIFIRDALVAGDVELKAAFFQHNRELIAEVTRLEDKTRRRDLLVDEETLYAFYDERIPADVASLKTFEDWRHRAEKDSPRLLFLTPEQVLARAADADRLCDFPDQLMLAGHELALRYHFEPGHEADGVTLLLPAGLLQDLPEQPLEWLVPGLLGDKVEALLRGLPKALRRQLVPLPDT